MNKPVESAVPTVRKWRVDGPARWLAFVALIAGTACGDGRGGTQGRRPGAAWRAIPTVRAGQLDGPGSLASVFNVAIGPQGRIFVAQSAPLEISVFDPQGRFVQTLGRRGPGPGEFQTLGRIGWTGNTLWALGLGRVHLFDAGLEFVHTVTPVMPEVPDPRTRMIPGPVMADGSILGIPFSVAGAGSEPIMLVDETGSGARVVAHVSSAGRSIRVDPGNGRSLTVSHPWPDFPLWLNATDGSSIVVVERRVPADAASAEIRIVRIDLAGDTLVDEAHRYDPVPLTDAQREETYRTLAERHARRRPATAGQTYDALRDAVPAPRFHPPVTGLVVGEDGTIWLRREELRDDTVEWDVFDRSGARVSRVRLPTSVEVHAAEAGRIWGVVRDTLDVPYVQVYRIEPR